MPGAAIIQRTNPAILQQDILDELFSYLHSDARNLLNCRLVCKTWNRSACRILKKSLRWRTNTSPSTEDGGKEFMSVMSHCTDILFSNFHFNHDKEDVPNTLNSEFTPIFINRYAPQVQDLKLHGIWLPFLNILAPHLSHLQSLQLYGLSIQTLHDNNNCLTSFPKLKSIGLFPAQGEIYQGNAQTCINLLKNSPALLHLDILLSRANILRIFEEVNLKSLRTFRTIERSRGVILKSTVLNAEDLEQLPTICPGLTTLALGVDVGESDSALLRMLGKYSAQLEELEIAVLRTDVRVITYQFRLGEGPVNVGQPGPGVDVEPKPVEEASGNVSPPPSRRSSLPGKFPALKRLSLQNWDLQNNFNIFQNMPSLKRVDLRLKPCSLPIIFPTPTGSLSSSCSRVSQLTVSISTYQDNLDMIAALASTFPHVINLRTRLTSDAALHKIYSCWPELKRLTVNCRQDKFELVLMDEEITDAGITGIPLEDVDKMIMYLDVDDFSEIEVSGMRKFPYIGDLKNLQHFEMGTTGAITKYSIYYGFAYLNELTYLNVHPETNKVGNTRIGPLADNCKALVKLDVGRKLDDDDVEYAKAKLPFLELVNYH